MKLKGKIFEFYKCILRNKLFKLKIINNVFAYYSIFTLNLNKKLF